MNKQLSIINIAQYQFDNTSTIKKHKHNNAFQLFYVVYGSAHFFVMDQEYTVGKNKFILVSPQTMHGMRSGECNNFLVFDFKFTVSDFELADELKSAKVFYTEDSRVTKLFLQIRDELENTEFLSGKIIYNYFETILYMLVRLNNDTNVVPSKIIYIDPQKVGPCVKKVLNTLEETSITPSAQYGNIDEIAKLVGYNKQYMCRTFSDEVGISIVRFQQLLKIDKAKEMVESTNYSVSEIAALLGYSSQSYFIKLFRENTGMSPLKYRQSGQRSARNIRYPKELLPTAAH